MTKKETNIIKRITIAVIGILVALGVSFGVSNIIDNEQPESSQATDSDYSKEYTTRYEEKSTVSDSEQDSQQENTHDTEEILGNLEIHYMDVGQGDATLIKCGDKTMLIDAGDNNKGMSVRAYLESQGVETIDYVIGTHPDADHIGGLDVVIYNFDCGTIFMPDEKKNTKTYEDVIQTIKDRNYKITLPEVGTTYSLGEAEFTIIAPNDDYSDANNESIGILLEFGETSFLFTGDAEEDAEKDILKNGIDIHADVYKAGHHGSRTSSSDDFLAAIEPTAIVVSCGEDNSYGHPHADILNYCRMNNIPLYRTDMQGTIVAKSDGKSITWNMSPYDGY